jgi:hypothetical protein
MASNPTNLPANSEENRHLAKLIEGLGPAEGIALDTIMRGGTLTAAALAANVNRSTIYLWLEKGHPFAEALNRWKLDLAATARTRLLMLTDSATSAVAQSLQRGDSRTALRLLEKLGIMAAPPVGPTHIEAVTANESIKVKTGVAKAKRARAVSSFIGEWNSVPETESPKQEGEERDVREALEKEATDKEAKSIQNENA